MKNKFCDISNFPVILSAIFLMVSSPSAIAAVEEEKPNDQRVPWHPYVDLYLKELPRESLQFDFLIGDWDFRLRRYDPQSGAVISAQNAVVHAEYLGDKRMIFQEFTGSSPETGQVVNHGVTLRTYSPTTGQWINVWLRSFGEPPQVFPSQWENNEMITLQEQEDPQYGKYLYRQRFFNITADSFEAIQEVSGDGGKTWHRTADRIAKRRAEENGG